MKYILVYESWASKLKFFVVKEYFLINFDFKNGIENEFKDNNEKSCSLSRNRVSHKIDFKAVWPRNGHDASVGVKAAAFSICCYIFEEEHFSGILYINT